MSRKYTFHDIVRRALEKDGWTIIHDPLLSGWTQLKLTVEIREQGTGNREQGTVSNLIPLGLVFVARIMALSQGGFSYIRVTTNVSS
ncbi:element excision factor XisH family protein [Coleofasciculus sp.]|uniref:element excision factor XisH family protein n=1 Tax=Coleofasciculus sp. TaxID=3100458 RepID=UPI003A2EA31F